MRLSATGEEGVARVWTDIACVGNAASRRCCSIGWLELEGSLIMRYPIEAGFSPCGRNVFWSHEEPPASNQARSQNTQSLLEQCSPGERHRWRRETTVAMHSPCDAGLSGDAPNRLAREQILRNSDAPLTPMNRSRQDTPMLSASPTPGRCGVMCFCWFLFSVVGAGLGACIGVERAFGYAMRMSWGGGHVLSRIHTRARRIMAAHLETPGRLRDDLLALMPGGPRVFVSMLASVRSFS